MATISFANIDVPTPNPYSKSDPNAQQENFHYVLLQLCQLAKNAGITLNDQRLPELKTAIEGIGLTVNPADLSTINEKLIDLADSFK